MTFNVTEILTTQRDLVYLCSVHNDYDLEYALREAVVKEMKSRIDLSKLQADKCTISPSQESYFPIPENEERDTPAIPERGISVSLEYSTPRDIGSVLRDLKTVDEQARSYLTEGKMKVKPYGLEKLNGEWHLVKDGYYNHVALYNPNKRDGRVAVSGYFHGVIDSQQKREELMGLVDKLYEPKQMEDRTWTTDSENQSISRDKPSIAVVKLFDDFDEQKIMDFCDQIQRTEAFEGGMNNCHVNVFLNDLDGNVFEASLLIDSRFKDKVGDKKTPEGEFYVAQKNPNSKYFKSLLINYPNSEDAERGEKEGLITREQGEAIKNAGKKCQMPLQDTNLGGYIELHGGGGGRDYEDWTHGCIALDDADIQEVYNFAEEGCYKGKKKTMVSILP